MKTTVQKLTDSMRRALEFYAVDRTHEAVAYPTTGTRVALIRRGLLTTGHHAWDHRLTVDGESVVRIGLTVAEAFELASEIHAAIVAGLEDGPNCLDEGEAALTDAELADKITRRVEMLNGWIGHEHHNRHTLRMVQAHAWWLALYRAERDRRSRELAASAYVDAVSEGLARRGRLASTPLVQIHQAAQDLLHGEALEQYRAERPEQAQASAKAAYLAAREEHWHNRGYGVAEAAAFARWDWLASSEYSANPLVR